MNDEFTLAQMTVADLLARFPQTIPVFNRHGMACAGCDIADLETVGEAIEIYRLDAALFLAELMQVIARQEEP